MQDSLIDFSKLPDKAPDYDLTALLEAGCHFGHQKRKWHPKMKQYIYIEKDGVHIFDLVKTASQLQVAYNYAYSLGKNGKSIIFVGTKRQAKEIVQATAKDVGAMYITSRWLGGLLTNWNQISKSLKRMIKIEEGFKNDEFAGYTKFERVKLEKEQGKLERFFDGIRGLKGKPDCIFVIDPKREHIVVTEANMKGVPVIAMVDSNTDPTNLDIAIPANDDAVSSIEFIVEAVGAGYKAGKTDKSK